MNDTLVSRCTTLVATLVIKTVAGSGVGLPWAMLHYVGARAAGKVLSRAMRSEPPQQTTKNPVTQPSTLLLIKNLENKTVQ